jgi:Co/Zn/Cd efflux system component
MAESNYNLLNEQTAAENKVINGTGNKCCGICMLTGAERSLWIVGTINMVYVLLQLLVAAQTGSLAMVSQQC